MLKNGLHIDGRVWVAIGALIAVYMISLWATLSTTQKLIYEFNISNLAQQNVSTDELFELSATKLVEIQESSAKSKRVATPLMALCVLGRVVPFVADNCDAINALFRQSAIDSDAAISLLAAVEKLHAIVGSFRSGSIDSSEEKLSGLIAAIESDLDDYDSSAAQAAEIQFPDVGQVIGKLKSARLSAVNAERDLHELANFVRVGLSTLESAIVLKTIATAEFEGLVYAGGSSADLKKIHTVLAKITPHLETFSTNTERFNESIPAYLENSSVDSIVTSIGDDARLVENLFTGISVPIEILDESFKSSRSSDQPLFKNGAVVEMLQILHEEGEALTDASERLVAVQQKLSSGHDLDNLVGEKVAAKLESLLNRYSGLIGVLANAPEVVGDFLGKDGPKRYLVLGQSSDEIRPAGGFTSSVWSITLDQGVLVETEYINVLTFGERWVLDQIPPPPDALQTHMDAGAWYLRDVGWSPNFKSVAETVVLMNTATDREPIDGVISLTQWGFVHLVTGLGSIGTAEGQLSGTEVMQNIEDGTDSEGTDYLLTLFNLMIESLTIGGIQENFTEFGQSFLSAFDEKQIMLYSTDDELENKIEELGWSGNLSWQPGDVLGVFDSNIGWNKVGRRIERHVAYDVELKTDGGGKAQLSVSYVNNSKAESSGCEQQSEPPSGGNVYAILKDGCYWNYVRVYTPIGSKSSILPALELPEGSVAARTGVMAPGSDTMSVSFDDIGQYYGGVMALEPDSYSTLKFEYDLPVGTAEVSGNVIDYLLLIPVQSGFPGSTVTINVSFPDEFQIVDVSTGAGLIVENTLHFESILGKDIALRVAAEKRD